MPGSRTSAGWPAEVERLLRLAPNIDVVAARSVSVGARESLAERGVGWFDETGGAHITLPSGLVVIRHADGPPQPPAGEGRWARSTVAVAEAILSGTDPRVAPIQHATGLSRGATAKALAQLESEGLLERATARGPGSSRHVADASGLLDRYATAVATLAGKTRVVRMHRLWDDPLDSLIGDLAPRLAAAHVAWAATGAAASMLLAPYLSNLTVVELYVDESLTFDPPRLADLLGARPVDRGHRIEVVLAPTMPLDPTVCLAGLPGYQLLDSLAVDGEGNVCVATLVNGGITTITPAGETSHLATGDLLTTNICFGDSDGSGEYRDAYITVSGTGKLLHMRWPN